MTLRKRLEQIRRLTRSRPGPAKRHRYPLGLEPLESRRLLAAAVSQFPLRTVGGPSEYITKGPDNKMWFTLSSNNVGRLDTITNKVDEYPIPSPNSAPGPIIKGPDGKLWFVETAYNQFGVVDPTTGVITEVPVLPGISLQIQDITAGPDGGIWFTEYTTNKIGRIDPTTHAVQEFAIPTINSQPYGITQGPDGNIWFTESATNKVGRINPTTHTVDDFVIYTSGNAQARGIAVGSDNNLYFTMNEANQIGRISPYSPQTVSSVNVPAGGAGLTELTAGYDGRIWFTESGSYRVGALNVSTNAIKEYGVDYQGGPLGIAGGPDGNLWVGITSGRYSEVEKVTTSGAASAVGVPSSSSTAPYDILAADDGTLWFTQAGSQLGTYNPTTHYSTEVALPSTSSGYALQHMTRNPEDGSFWFTENAPYGGPVRIARIDTTTGSITDNRVVPTNGVNAQGIAFDSTYNLFYFAEYNGNRLATVDPRTNAIAENFPTLPANSDPYGVVADSTGRLWFTEYGTGKLGVFDPSAPQAVTQISLPSGSAPKDILLGPDGNIWLVETGGASRGVAVYNPKTMQPVKQILAPADESIAIGPDNAIWFSEASGVGRIDTTTYGLTSFAATNNTPEGVVAGKDGNIYFTGAGTGYPTYYPNLIGSVDLTPAATASVLDITSQPPATVTAGKGFGLIVQVESSPGKVDTFYNGPVTISLGFNPGSSTLSGTLTRNAVAGLAFFPGLNLGNTGLNYTIQASIPGLTPVTSNPFQVTLAATHFAVTTQPPGSLPVNTPITVAVAAEDDSGNIDSSFNGTVSASLADNSGMGNSLGGASTIGASNGVAVFPGLTLGNPGTNFTIQLTDDVGFLTSARTNSFNVTPQPATHLVVTTPPPAGVVAGDTFGLVVSAENDLGQVDYAKTGPVSLLLQGGNGSALGGVLTVNLAAGVATFSGLSIDRAGSNYAILAETGLLASATTGPISVIAASASSLKLTSPAGGSVITGVPFPVTVAAIDPFGNLAANYSGTVHISSTDAKFAPPADYGFLPGDGGTHTFQLTLLTLGGRSLTVTDDANSTITATVPLQVNPPTATVTKLTLTPSSTVYGQSVTLKATVSQNSGTGTVTFLDGSTVLGAVKLVGAGATTASLSTSALFAGGHSLTASYSGSSDGTLASSMSTVVALVIGRATATASVNASSPSTSPNQAETLTATIKSIAGTPTGTASFLDGTTSLGSVKLDPTGHATLVVPKLGLGTHPISVSYSGDSNDTTSTSAAIHVYVGDLPKSDFDGDGKADLAVYGKDPKTGKYRFKIATSSTGFNPSKAIIFDNNGYGFGGSQSTPVPADYFGDGKDAYALWTPNATGGMTFTAISSVTSKSITVNFGTTKDLPVVDDVDGDGKADFGVYGPDPAKPGHYRFAFLTSSAGFNAAKPLVFDNNGYGFGGAQSIPVVADFDGSGKAGFGLFNPSSKPGASSFTYVSSAGSSFTKAIGAQSDVAMAADYDGDGKADLVLYGPDPAKAGHYRYDVLTSSTGYDPSKAVVFDNSGYGYGGAASVPVAADYEGNGKLDFALFTPDAIGGMQYVYQQSQTGPGLVLDFATATDIALTSPTYLRARKVRG